MTAADLQLLEMSSVWDLTESTSSICGIEDCRPNGSTMVICSVDATDLDRLKYTVDRNDRHIMFAWEVGTVLTARILEHFIEDPSLDGFVSCIGANEHYDPIPASLGSALPIRILVQ